jgi:Tfp pilus assembly protein FimT
MIWQLYKNRSSKDAGFSLLETLLLLSVIALLTALFASSLNPFLNRSEGNHMTKLQARINETRIKAMASGTPVAIDLNDFELCPNTENNISVRENGSILATPVCIVNNTYTIDWMTGEVSLDAH